jgi:hypothetical protein
MCAYRKNHCSDYSFCFFIGPRILTVFLYLNDVEEGGGTRFTDLDITVMPKQGRAILWPSVTNNDPLEQELLTHHEAMPVLKGIKCKTPIAFCSLSTITTILLTPHRSFNPSNYW